MFINVIRQHFYMNDTKSNRVFVFIASGESKPESFCGSVLIKIYSASFHHTFRDKRVYSFSEQ